MNEMREHDYLIKPDTGVASKPTNCAPGPASTDIERIAESVRLFLLLYDPEARTEIHHPEAEVGSSAQRRANLRVKTKVVNSDIVDSAVRVCAIPLRLLTSRTEECITNA